VTSKPDFKVMVLLLVFMQLTRDLFAIAKFLFPNCMLKHVHVIDIGWTSVCLSVCLSVRPSHAGIVSKRLNILSYFLHHTIAHSFSFCVYQDLREIPTGLSPAGSLNRGGGV